MTCRALLLGLTDEAGLPGVAHSVAAFEDLLRTRYKFTDIRAFCDPDGPAIRRLFGELADATEPSDAVVVYYAGHGSLFRAPRVGEDGHVCHVAVVPRESDDPTIDGFRGILGTELSRLIRVLACRTNNVTVILDCCYAADMLRVTDDGLDDPIFQAIEQRTREIAQAAIRSRQRVRSSAPMLVPGSNVVLVLASTSGGRSFPDPDPATQNLLFTRCLLAALAEDGAAQRTWTELLLTLRRTLRKERRAQLPGVVGACFRLPFTTKPGGPGPGFVPAVVREDGRLAVDTGEAAGIHMHDNFTVYSCTGYQPTARYIGKAKVVQGALDHAVLQVTSVEEALPTVVYIRPGDSPREPTPLSLGDGVTALLLGRPREWLPGPSWRPAQANEPAVVRAEVDTEGRAIVIHDHLGERIAIVVPHEAARVAAQQACERAAGWRSLDAMLDRPTVCQLGDCCRIKWGLLEAREGLVVDRLLAPDAVITANTASRMFFRVHNLGVFPTVYVRAYRIRVDREMEHWEDLPDGLCIESKACAYLGDQSYGHGRGIPLEWPGEVPRAWFSAEPAREWAVLCVANAPIPRQFLARAIEPVRRTHRSADVRYSILAVPYRLAPDIR